MRQIVAITAGMVFMSMFLVIDIAQGTDQEGLIQRIKDNYQGLASFQADIYIERIEQGKKVKGEGNIWAKEGKFRIEIETIASGSPENEIMEKQTIVFDSKIFWIYSQPKNELISVDLSKLADLPDLAKGQIQDTVTQLEEVALNFFSPQFSPEKEIEISENEWEGKSFYVFKDGQRETWVNKEDYLIYRVITYDKAESVTSDVQLTVVNINEKISDELFTFRVPEGVQPLDMVEMIKAMFEAFEKKESD